MNDLKSNQRTTHQRAERLVGGFVPIAIEISLFNNNKHFTTRSLGVALPGKLYPNGYTLVEILLAMLMTSILVLGLQAAFRQTTMMVRRSEAAEPDYRRARLLTELFRHELAGLYLPPEPENQEQSDQNNEIKNFQLTRRTDGTLDLSFFTMMPCWQQDAAGARPVKVGYQLERDEQSDLLSLYRIEQAYGGEQPIGPQSRDVLVGRLKELSFSVFNEQEQQWQPAFQSSQQLPQAIRVAFQFAVTHGREATDFSTTYTIFPHSILVITE